MGRQVTSLRRALDTPAILLLSVSLVAAAVMMMEYGRTSAPSWGLGGVHGFTTTSSSRSRCSSTRKSMILHPQARESKHSLLWLASVYTPPDFSVIEDEEDSENEAKSPKKDPVMTPGNMEEEEDAGDSYTEPTERSTSRRRPIIRNKNNKSAVKRSTTEMATTSWMDKNIQFGKQVGIEASLQQQQEELKEQLSGGRRGSPSATSTSTTSTTTSSKPPPRRAVPRGDLGSTNRPPPRRPGSSSPSTVSTFDGQKQRPSPSSTFRQDFRKTRVFVQGIPDGTSWQDLKDHFRVAGEVVFASVSVDAQTGASKGHGIVQFETTDMAQTAIAIMRDHPLFDTHPLFVREDVQEGNSDNVLRSSRPRNESEGGGNRGPTPPTMWKCANDDNTEYLSDEDRTAIRTLIKARDDARRRKTYHVSDRLRDELKDQYGVFLDDRLKLWWTSLDGKRVPQTIQDIKGQDGKWDFKGPAQSWRYIPTTPENDACVNADLVEALLMQRDVARREKDFTTADTLLEEARNSPDGDLTLRIHDESRTWRVWTDEPPPAFSRQRTLPRQRGGRWEDNDDENKEDQENDQTDGYPSSWNSNVKDPLEMRQRAAQQCVELLQKHNPEKVSEVRTLLKKFPGREFGILKKLQQTYGKK